MGTLNVDVQACLRDRTHDGKPVVLQSAAYELRRCELGKPELRMPMKVTSNRNEEVLHFFGAFDYEICLSV